MARRKGKKRQGGGLATLLFGTVLLVIFFPRFLPVVLILLGIFLVVAWLWWRRSRPKTATARELTERFAAVSTMSGGQFEIFVADHFRAMGRRTTVIGRTGDQGVDLIVEYEGKRLAVQCKNYKKRIGNRPVQEVYAGARHHRCELAWVVAPAGYTKGATELARSVGVTLYDADALRTWIRLVDQLEMEGRRAKKAQSGSTDMESVNASATAKQTDQRQRAVYHPHPDDPPPNG